MLTKSKVDERLLGTVSLTNKKVRDVLEALATCGYPKLLCNTAKVPWRRPQREASSMRMQLNDTSRELGRFFEPKVCQQLLWHSKQAVTDEHFEQIDK
mmetsp:Transcript_20353/g.38072  ORF Transcript_20353/g.38072 Transcript_20353/m.38072 type:complete len:98 (-) Transcript_20353:176-469(-)